MSWQEKTNEASRLLSIVIVVIAVALSWLPAIERQAEMQIDAGLKRALVSFGVAKALNGAISVAKSTQLAFTPVGLGFSVTAGEVLDPLDDMVETFSHVMLVAAVAFGIEKVLLAAGAHWAVTAAFTLVAFAWALLHYARRAPEWLTRLVIVLLMIRFAIPVVTIGSDWMFRTFMAERYATASRSLEGVSETTSQSVDRQSREMADAANEQPVDSQEAQKAKGGFFSKFWPLSKPSAGGAADGGPKTGSQKKPDVEGLLARFQHATEHIIDVMVVFILQTIVVPIVLLWALLKVAGGVFATRADRLVRSVVPRGG